MLFSINDHLRDFERKSYVGDPWKELGALGVPASDVIDCSLGTNPYGSPPGLLKVALDQVDFSSYPDPFGSTLKEAISRAWSGLAEIPPENIFLGTGSMGLLERLNKLFLQPGKKVLGYCPQFTEYITEIRACGAQYSYVPLPVEANFAFSPDLLLPLLNPSVTLVYIDNPNNPTGQAIDLEDLEILIQAAEKHQVPVVVDEAYGDFMEPDQSAMSLVKRYDNLIVIRSFSKGYGLAGLRVGYCAMSPSLALQYRKIDLPFSVGALGDIMAREALKDKEFLPRCRQRIAAEKRKITAACSSFRFAATSPQIPIMVMGWPNEKVDLFRELLRIGIITESGEDFLALGKNFIRLRVPADASQLLPRILKLQERLLEGTGPKRGGQ